MYRQRLRSATGCLRCKNRHRKCDETRPRCSFCARHDVTCVWPDHPPPQTRDDLASRKSSILVTQVAHDESAPSLDPFHVMPVHHSKDTGVNLDRLQSFFVGITQSTLPFDIAQTHHELTRGWLISSFSDEAVYSAFVTYCAWFYAQRSTRTCKLDSLDLNNEARSLAILRHRIEKDETVAEGTLLAAALHFFTATLSTKSILQLSQIAKGISALVAARGGPTATMHSVSPSTRQSLIFVDVFNSLLTTQRPFLRNVELPPKPLSYDLLYKGSTVDKDIANHLGSELVDVLQDLRFALFFRMPSQQTRKLTSEESRYLFMLLQRISYGLCNQQSRLATTRSLSEIVVYGMALVKEEVLLDIVQHPILPISILQRLRFAISSYQGPARRPSSTLAIWASTMALVGTEFELERAWALEFITRMLTDRYGLSWPPGWITELRQELQRVLWHQRIESAFATICAKVYHLRTQARLTEHMLRKHQDIPEPASIDEDGFHDTSLSYDETKIEAVPAIQQRRTFIYEQPTLDMIDT